jgi:gas vesicle protein
LTTLEILEDIIKFVDNSVLNNRKYELLLPRMINYFLDNIRYSYKEIKSSFDDQIKTLKHEKEVVQSVLEQTKELFNKNKETLENEIKSYKEQLLQQRLDVISP